MSLFFSYPLIFRQLIGMIHRSFDESTAIKIFKSRLRWLLFCVEKFLTVMVLMDAVGKTWNPFFKQRPKKNNNDSKLIVADRYIENVFFF